MIRPNPIAMWIVCILIGAGTGSAFGFLVACAKMLGDAPPGKLAAEPNLLIFCGVGFVAGATLAPVLFAVFTAIRRSIRGHVFKAVR